METIINKAIEGGWLKGKNPSINNFNKIVHRTIVVNCSKNIKLSVYEIVLDPLFWQALGKSMKWINLPCDAAFLEGMSHRPKVCDDCKKTAYMACWHRFIDHLAAGKPAASFFDELLKDNI